MATSPRRRALPVRPTGRPADRAAPPAAVSEAKSARRREADVQAVAVQGVGLAAVDFVLP